jgi:LysM repeat protein
MTLKRISNFTVFILVAALLILSLSACTLSASKGITEGGETTGEFPVPEDENMGLFDLAATQTASAAVLPSAEEATPLAAFTATPLPTALPTATAVPQIQIEPTAGKPPTTYTLQKGEFPFCIARRFNVNQNELLALNGLGLNSTVLPGTKLKIPQTGNPFVSDRSLIDHPTQYTVKAGDTIYTIACKFGDVSPDMIALANNLKEPYNLTVGQTLEIP